MSGHPQSSSLGSSVSPSSHRVYEGEASNFLMGAYGVPSAGYIGTSGQIQHHYANAQTGLINYFSEAAATLQNSFCFARANSHGPPLISQETKALTAPSFTQQQQQRLQQLQLLQQHKQKLQEQPICFERHPLITSQDLVLQDNSKDVQNIEKNQFSNYCSSNNLVSNEDTDSANVLSSRYLVSEFVDSVQNLKKYYAYNELNKHGERKCSDLAQNLPEKIPLDVDAHTSTSFLRFKEVNSSNARVNQAIDCNLQRDSPVSNESNNIGITDDNSRTQEDSSLGTYHELALNGTLSNGSCSSNARKNSTEKLSDSNLSIFSNSSQRGKFYYCSLCEFTCTKQTELMNHVAVHPDDKPFHCTHCDYKGAKFHYLRNHLLTHSSRPQLTCPHCNYKCFHNGALKVHMRRHSPNKRYGCTYCSYRTHFKGNLKLHLRVHTGEKPYACTVCDFRCTQSGSLKIHMRGHSGEKPYACKICEYRSKHKGNLVMHLRKHTGDKPYQCDHCTYRSTQRMALNKHVKTVHGHVTNKINFTAGNNRLSDSSADDTTDLSSRRDEQPYSRFKEAAEEESLTLVESQNPKAILGLRSDYDTTPPSDLQNFANESAFRSKQHSYEQLHNPVKTNYPRHIEDRI